MRHAKAVVVVAVIVILVAIIAVAAYVQETREVNHVARYRLTVNSTTPWNQSVSGGWGAGSNVSVMWSASSGAAPGVLRITSDGTLVFSGGLPSGSGHFRPNGGTLYLAATGQTEENASVEIILGWTAPAGLSGF